MSKKTELEETPVQEALPNVVPTEAVSVAEPVEEKVEPKKPRGSKTEKPAVQVEPQEPVLRKVRVMLLQDVDCLINGVRYEHPAKKMIEVPEDVAQILVFGGKAYRM